MEESVVRNANAKTENAKGSGVVDGLHHIVHHAMYDLCNVGLDSKAEPHSLQPRIKVVQKTTHCLAGTPRLEPRPPPPKQRINVMLKSNL
jgi:hypothetical protein